MDEWEKLGWNSREVAKALFQASNDDKRKFISHAFEKVDSVWGRAAAILFPNKQPNESDRRFIYQIWVDNRKNVEFEYDKLSQKKRFPKKLDNVTKKGIDDDVDDEQPCVCERIIRKLPGEQRTICTSCRRHLHNHCIKMEISDGPENFICGYCTNKLQVPPMFETSFNEGYLVEDVSTWHHASDGQDEDEISIDSVSSEDEDLLEDTDSDSDSQTSISEILQQMKLDNLEVLSSIHSNEVGSDGTLEGKSDDEFATDETLMYGLSAAALEELSNLREDGISDIDYETLQKFDESTKPVGKHEFPTTSHVPNVNTKEQPPYKITGIKKVQSGCKEGKQKSPEQSEDDEDFQTSVGRGSNNISAKYNSDNKSPDGLKETHDKDKYFDTSCLPKRFDMTVSAEDWRKIVVIKPNKSGTKKEHFKWHSEFSNTLRKHFHRTNKVCNPTINTKFIRNPIPIVGNFITVYMCCNEKECKTKWIFSVARNPKPNSDVLISVVGEGSMKHPKSNKGGVRWIRGKQKQGQEKVSLKFPAAERITKISSADQEQLNYGNWAEVPTLKAHQRMREKIIGKDDLHKDVAHDIAKTIPNLNERFDDKWIPGYVQIFQVYPIKIVLFTKRQMSLLKDLQNQDHDIFLQIDATGVLIRPLNEPWDTRKPLLYTVIIRSTNKTINFPLTEMVTTDNTSLNVYLWLYRFFNTYKKQCNVASRNFGIKKLEMDFSKTLITACLYVFTGLTLEDYLSVFWIYMTEQKDKPLDVFPIHVCRFHINRAIQQKIKEIFKKEKVADEAYEPVVKIAKSFIFGRNIKSFQRRLKDFAIICGFEYMTPSVQARIEHIRKEVEIGPEIWKKIPAGKVEEPKSDNVPFWKRSQFGLMAEFIFEKYNELNSEHNEFWKTKNYPPNACYSPDFLNYIKVYIAPYYPIISHAVFECCGLPVTDDTTNKIEQYHGLLKCNIYKNVKSQKLSRFIRNQAEVIAAYCNTTEANLHTEPNYKPELSESEEETKPPDKEDSDFINEEPNWDAPQVSIKRPKKCQYGKSFAKKKREVSPERELEVFKKSQKRAKSVSEISAVMGAIPFIPWGGTFRGKNNSSVPLHNTCSIDTVIQILCGLYTNVPQFQEFLRRERTIDPLALSVDCMVRQCQNGEINQAKTTWITEIMKYKPDEKGGDLQGCELEQGFGLLMPWMTINRYVMCTTENCPNYVDVSGEVNLSSALATCIKDDMRILQKRTPNQILHQLNNMTAAHISCKICNIRGVKAHEIVTNAPFLVYPVIHDKQYHFPESELDLTQTIKGKKYKVFAYTAIRGVTQKNIPNDTVIPHFVAVLLHKNKRILFNGLKDCYQDLTSDLKDSKSAYDVEGGITSVWLVPT